MAMLISLTAIANKRKLPFPVLLVTAGLFIGFIPQLPELALDPDVVFLIFLPPLLYDAAFKTSWHEFKSSIRPISALAITLVFFTTTVVAVTAHYVIPDFTWPLSFVLGAVVSPPDAVAASGIIKGLGLNKKVITILEGESLFNDASALIAYRYAVIAVTTGTFIFWKAGLQFLLVSTGGIIIGVATGYLLTMVHKKMANNPVVQTSLTLLSPFVSYLLAEQFHMSGVLAVVSTGLLISWRSPEVFSYRSRMRINVVWETLIFLLHGFVFMLIGLQLPSIINDLGNYPFFQILGYGLLISLVTIIVRIIWVFTGAYWQHYYQKKKQAANKLFDGDTPDNTWKNVLIVAWTGTRGVISLATALALPLVLADGTHFPKRHSIIFLAFVVIFVTLVVQGLSLPLIIRWLKIKPPPDPGPQEKELKLYLFSSTLDFIENEFPGQVDNRSMDYLKKKYERLIEGLNKEIHSQHSNNQQEEKITSNNIYFNAQLEINKFQRALLLKLHKEGEYRDEAIRKVEREMDIHELKLNMKVVKEE